MGEAEGEGSLRVRAWRSVWGVEGAPGPCCAVPAGGPAQCGVGVSRLSQQVQSWDSGHRQVTEFGIFKA